MSCRLDLSWQHMTRSTSPVCAGHSPSLSLFLSLSPSLFVAPSISFSLRLAAFLCPCRCVVCVRQRSLHGTHTCLLLRGRYFGVLPRCSAQSLFFFWPSHPAGIHDPQASKHPHVLEVAPLSAFRLFCSRRPAVWKPQLVLFLELFLASRVGLVCAVDVEPHTRCGIVNEARKLIELPHTRFSGWTPSLASF